MDIVPAPIEAYCEDHGATESALLAELAAETRETQKWPQMLVGPIEGGLLRLLALSIGAKRIVEVGTYTGYSALWMADALPDGGELITCDNDPVSTELAKRYWARSPHGSRIELRLGDAVETVKSIEGPIDMMFIDADKKSYVQYWEAGLSLLRQGGLLVVDNCLWGGAVLAPESESDKAIVAFNAHAAADERVDNVLLTVRDGVMVGRKR